MNNFGVKVIGNNENEEIQQFDTSLADLDAVIMSQFQLVAAAAEVPATKLLGTTPKGFNSTGEYDARSYHQKLTSIQQHGLSPLLDRHHLLLIKAFVAPKFGIAPFKLESNWNPVDEPTAAELADINLKKAQADSTYVQTGAIDGVDVRDKLIADKDSGFNGIQPISDPLNMEEKVDSDNMD
jgi:phage-related protein (TIGR01555 family)